MDKQVAKSFADNCLIELELDFKLDTEYKFFTFLDEDLTVLSGEKEVLLKSGIIIHYQSFNQNTDQDGVKYILEGKVISFNQKEIVASFIKDLN